MHTEKVDFEVICHQSFVEIKIIVLFSRVAKEGFLKDLFDDLKKDDDVLVQLNAIEIVSNLAESKQGFEYLHSLEILTQMDTRLNQVSSG